MIAGPSAVRLGVTLLLLLLSTGAGFKMSEEKIPDTVRKDLAEQIQRSFGKADFEGIPLFDPKIDWNDFANWPEEFVFQGHRFKGKYAFLGSDYFGRVKSRAELRPDHGYSITYETAQTNAPPLHSFSCYWSRHGYVKERSIHWEGKRVFTVQFYPNGDLYSFQRDTKKDGWKGDYFHEGQQVGGFVGSEFKFQGRSVPPNLFWRELEKLTKGVFPREA